MNKTQPDQTPASEASKRLDVLEAETALARARVGADVENIRARLTPAGLIQEVQTQLQARVQRSAPEAGSASVPASVPVRVHPGQGAGWRPVSPSTTALTTLLGAGLAWLLLRSSKRREGR